MANGANPNSEFSLIRVAFFFFTATLFTAILSAVGSPDPHFDPTSIRSLFANTAHNTAPNAVPERRTRTPYIDPYSMTNSRPINEQQVTMATYGYLRRYSTLVGWAKWERGIPIRPDRPS